MRTRKIVVVLVLFGFVGACAATNAKPSLGGEKSFFDRLDDFGKAIFDGILPQKDKAEKQQNDSARRQAANWQDFSDPGDQTGVARAGSVLADDRHREAAKDNGGSRMIKPQTRTGSRSPTVIDRYELDKPVRTRRPRTDEEMSKFESPETLPSKDGRPIRKRAVQDAQPDEPVARPLHKRLADFRQSVFASADHRPPQRDGHAQRNISVKSDAGPEPEEAIRSVAPTPQPTGRPLIAQRTGARSHVAETPPSSYRGAAALNAEASNVQTPDNATGVVSHPADEAKGVLSARKSPNLSVETFGPRTISVGRKSTYEVCVANSGDVAAEGLGVYVSLPEWADVAGMETGMGDVRAQEDSQHQRIVHWQVGRLDAQQRASLTLQIVPLQSRPFDLAIRWDYKPLASQAAIEVQEPKLALQLDGPDEVFFGQQEVFKLKLSNTGTGDAEDVKILLMPIGAGENVQAAHKVGTLRAGETRVLEVELTARQAGDLTVQVEAAGAGNLRAELAEKVLVRRADLKLDMGGPKVQFVDTTASYIIVVSNPGNAPARNVSFSLSLPSGAEYLSGIDGARPSDDGRKLVWRLASLPAQQELTFVVRCRMTAPGMSRMKLAAVADDDLSAAAETMANVEAVADLTMKVKDPAGPIPVGEEVIYEVRVRNRGTKEARDVEIFAYFSQGIEPIAAEGADCRLAPGQVIFQPISTLGPAEELVLKVRARADASGNHVFRAETHCKPLGARLISEATNRYYGDAIDETQTARHPATETATR